MATAVASVEKVLVVATKEQRAAALHALAKMAEKEAKGLRDNLPEGSSYAVDLQIAATIDDKAKAELAIHCDVSVGHDSTRASSTTPDYEGVVAWLLESMNEQTREARLRDLVAVYQANGGKLPVKDATREAVSGALAKLRSSKAQTVRGSVSCRYAIAE
jgi:hypothetical protein